MKRSTQVALVLMGAAGIGASAYAFTSKKNDCVPAAKPSATTPAGATDKNTKLDEPCSPRRSNTGYYRSYWRSSGPSSWWWPIFNRNPQPTTTTTTSPSNSPTSLGLTSRPTTTTTARPSTPTTTTRPGFGTTGTSIAHTTAS